ncbi:hypothetical protein ACHAQJ_001273 [Trichoderma viride]
MLTKEVPMIVEAADVLVTGPLNDSSQSTPPVADPTHGIWFNGLGEDGHEPLCLSRKDHQRCFVKTARKPYDLAVACVLLRAYLLAPSVVELSSDGYWDVESEWMQVRRLYNDLWPGEPCWCPWAEHAELEGTNPKPAETNVISKTPDISATTHMQAVQAQTSASVEGGKMGSLSDLVLQDETTTLQVDETCVASIRQWLAQCEKDTSHSKCQPSAIQWSTFAGVQLRVIDTVRRCIIVAPEKCQYMALSYVLGAVDQPTLTVDILDKLAEEGGLAIIWPKMSQTVRDAIIFCESLGERYLWIDALCIIHDSPRDMRLSIPRKRQIYAAAKCTLSATSTSTARDGLSTNLTADTLTFPTIDALYRHIETSPWSRHAWCYQEKVLSHRIIFFTSYGIYIQCQVGVYSGTGEPLTRDTGHPELDRSNVVDGMLSMRIGDGDGLESYLSAVEHYSSRTTPKQTDKINAFQGILQMYKGMMDGVASTFCFGLPTFAFDQTFCWRNEQQNPELRNPAFPSWSWLGWDNAIIFDRALVRKAHTDQIFAPFGANKQIDIIQQAGPGYLEICQGRKPADMFQAPHEFGFPATVRSFNRNPVLDLAASMVKLSIANEPKGSNGLSNCYAVLPNDNRHIPAGDTIRPLGFIWLHEQWRAQQENPCIMEFMALAGKPDVEMPGKWIITMLMCLQRMDQREPFGNYERLQIMDCELSEETWLKMGAVTTLLFLA